MPDHFDVRADLAEEAHIPKKPRSLHVINGFVERICTFPDPGRTTLVWLRSEAVPSQTAFHEAPPDNPTIGELKRAQSMRLRVYAEFLLRDETGRLHMLDNLSVHGDMPQQP